MRKGQNPLSQPNSLTDQLHAKQRQRRATSIGIQNATRSTHAPRNDPAPPLVLIEMPIENLRAPTRNVRRLTEAHIQEVSRSISAMGFCAPVLIGKEGQVLDGMVRVKAAQLLGMSSVPCIRIDHLSETEQRTLRLALNRLGEKGEWDLEELKLEFEDLVFSEQPIEITGFTLDEIDHIKLDAPGSPIEQGPLAPEKNAVAVSRLGDVYVMGSHKVACGDATDPNVWRKLMDEGETARLLLSDEPFNVRIKGHVSGSGHREFPMASGEMSDAEFFAFNCAWIESLLPWLCDGGVFGTFIDWRGYPIVHAAALQANLAALNLIVWAKTNAGMGSLYRSQHELLPLYKKGQAPHLNNISLGRRGRWRSNLWTYPGASSLGSDARKGLVEHPTVKPTPMLQDALLDLTNSGEIVLDPFLGSGSTLIAAAKTDRISRGLELDPLYVDVIINRYQTATGEAAILAEIRRDF